MREWWVLEVYDKLSACRGESLLGQAESLSYTTRRKARTAARQWSRLQAPQRRAACVAWRRRTSVMQQSLKGKVIVITGASSGFGKGAAMELARQGANVVLAARRSELLDQLARDCKAAGGEAIACPTDVSRRDEVERLAEV